jgi:hypothetical protein
VLGIIETIPSMLWSISPTEKQLISPKESLNMWGFLEELVDRGWERFLHPDDREKTATALARAISSGESYSVIHRVRRVDGEYR